jgi:hypothetical protein
MVSLRIAPCPSYTLQIVAETLLHVSGVEDISFSAIRLETGRKNGWMNFTNTSQLRVSPEAVRRSFVGKGRAPHEAR